MRARPLVIFGLDAADPELLLAWAADGSLPTIAGLLRAGTKARLASPETVSVHEIWTSVFSGAPLRRHGHYSNRVLVPGTYRLRALAPEEIDAVPFWSRLAGTERCALIVDVPGARLLPQVRGAQILGWGEHPTRARAVSHPPELLGETRRSVGARIATGERHLNRAWDRWNLRRILARIERKRALCAHLLRASKPDLAVVVFGDSHAAGHRFVKYQSRAGEEARRDRLDTALLAVYRAIDRAIGEVLRSFPETPNAVVVSNGGLRDGDPVGPFLEAFCRGLGYTAMLPAAGAKRRALDLYRRALPGRARRAVEGALPPDWGAALREERRLDAIDWARTTAFVIPSDFTGYLRVNLAGREPRGIVPPGAPYAALLDRLERDLHRLVDEATGEPVVERTVRGATLSGGEPSERLPDLFVDWRSRRGARGRVVHPEVVLDPPRGRRARDNHHSREGLVLAAGPDVARQDAPSALAPVDLAPFFLSLLGDPAAGPLGRGPLQRGALSAAAPGAGAPIPRNE